MQWIRHIIILGLLSALPFVQADADEDDKSINFFKGGAAKFEETIKGKVALVFLGMPWCGYCKQLTPKWLAVQKRVTEKDFPNKDKFYMAKINCQDSEELCNKQGVDGYPTVYLFKDGKRVEEYSGEHKALSIWQYILDQVADFHPDGSKVNHEL